jgi:hypothetical protein
VDAPAVAATGQYSAASFLATQHTRTLRFAFFPPSFLFLILSFFIDRSFPSFLIRFISPSSSFFSFYLFYFLLSVSFSLSFLLPAFFFPLFPLLLFPYFLLAFFLSVFLIS